MITYLLRFLAQGAGAGAVMVVGDRLLGRGAPAPAASLPAAPPAPLRLSPQQVAEITVPCDRAGRRLAPDVAERCLRFLDGRGAARPPRALEAADGRVIALVWEVAPLGLGPPAARVARRGAERGRAVLASPEVVLLPAGHAVRALLVVVEEGGDALGIATELGLVGLSGPDAAPVEAVGQVTPAQVGVPDDRVADLSPGQAPAGRAEVVTSRANGAIAPTTEVAGDAGGLYPGA